MKKTKIIVYHNARVNIINYIKLITIEEEVIKVDNILINGKDLKIKSMDDYMIEIIGEIKVIKYEEL